VPAGTLAGRGNCPVWFDLPTQTTDPSRMIRLRIATRESPLALWQAHHVRDRLLAAHPGAEVSLVPMTTAGDRWLARPLSEAGGKGLFVKELEQAMLDGHADLAVHSMKDVPAHLPDGLTLAVYLAGEDPRDAFVSERFATLAALPEGAHVGTASLRRQAQLIRQRPDLRISPVRGNVGTRLRKLDEGEYDAILLARAGLLRLGLAGRIRESFDPEKFIPAIGQGVIGIECRSDDAVTLDALRVLHDEPTAIRLQAERALNARIGGACQVPLAAHATVAAGRIALRAFVGMPDGSASVFDEREAPVDAAEALGVAAAEALLAQGADRILASLGASA